MKQSIRAYATFIIVATLYLFLFMRLLLPWTNEGIFLAGAVRVIQGQIITRDFFEIMGPGSFYLLAAFFKAFGVSFFSARLDLFIVSISGAVALYFLSRQIIPSQATAPVIVVAATIYGLQWPGVSHHIDSMSFALLALASMVMWMRTSKTLLLILAGMLAAITTCILLPKGGLLFASFLVWLLLSRAHRERYKAIGWLTVGYAVVIFGVLGYFWHLGVLRNLAYAEFVWPAKNYGAVNRVPYATGLVSQYWRQFLIPAVPRLLARGIASVLVIPFVFTAALPLILLGVALPVENIRRKPLAMLYLLAGVAVWLSEFHRRDIYHLVFGSSLLVVVTIYLLGQHGKWGKRAVQLLGGTAICLALFNLALAATAHPIATRAGTVWMYKTPPATQFLAEHTKPGDSVFIYPYSPVYYFLSATANPTRYSFFTYSSNTPAEFAEVLHNLDEKRVRYVVWDTNFMEKTAPLVFTVAARQPPEGPVVEEYFSSHYTVIEEKDGWRLLQRSSVDGPGMP